jgi:hypothetical protein
VSRPPRRDTVALRPAAIRAWIIFPAAVPAAANSSARCAPRSARKHAWRRVRIGSPKSAHQSAHRNPRRRALAWDQPSSSRIAVVRASTSDRLWRRRLPFCGAEGRGRAPSCLVGLLQGAPHGAASLVSSARLAAREGHAAVDRDGIADMRDVKHDREYGSFREFLSAVAVALKG